MNLPLAVVFLICAGVLVPLAELGFRVGIRLPQDERALSKSQVGPIQAAVLGLIGLLLGFTYSLAAGRFEERRLLLVHEANAIQTVYLRASLLPDELQRPMKGAVRKYLDVRIATRKKADDPVALQAGLLESERMQDEIWRLVNVSSRAMPLPVMITVVESINEMFDIGTERVASARAYVPTPVWLLVIFVSGAGSLATGYRAGLDGFRTKLSTWFLPLIISLVIVVISDFSDPLRGLIGVSQQPMLDVQQWVAQREAGAAR